MSSAPRKNGGIETPTIASTVSARSEKRPALIAASTPKHDESAAR